MRFPAVFIAICLASLTAWSGSPSGPRLGDDASGALTIRGSAQSTLGRDLVGGATRWELRNDLSAGVSYGDGTLDLVVPVVYRDLEGESLAGAGDLALRGAVELLRGQTETASDTFRIFPSVGISPGTSPRDWRWSLVSQAITPGVGVGYRHSDQKWAFSAQALAALPIALEGAAFRWGPSARLGTAVEYAPWQFVSARLGLDLKQQWAAHDAHGPIHDSQTTALIADFQAKVAPVRQLSIAAGMTQAIFTLSPGSSRHGQTYRLGLELAL